MKILMCSSEAVPFSKTGGLADVAGALPEALGKEGHEIVLVIPGYKASLSLPGVKRIRPGLSGASIGKSVNVYLVEHEFYFGRDSLYGDRSGDYIDNLDRFSYFCRRTLDLIKEIDFRPDVIHCHDWQTALIPVYLKFPTYSMDPFYKRSGTLFTIHNIGYQGVFNREEYPKIGLGWNFFGVDTLEYYDNINLLKGGIVFSDIINTVSPTYGREIQTEEYGFGMEGVLADRRDDIYGILNGLDYSVWDPGSDSHIAAAYSVKDPSGKSECKADLQRVCKFPVKQNTPVIGVVSRLAQQKGFDILSEALDKICRLDVQIVILGSGDAKYHQILESAARKYPKVVSLNIKFDDPLAHKIYAGSDIFLMPSRYEPCGLGQMISMKYGSLPLVFRTGGLADTVDAGCGFVFDSYSSEELFKTVKKALAVYQSSEKWRRLQSRAMKCDFSWGGSAREYVKLYEKALEKK